jgi:hypothetical protein
MNGPPIPSEILFELLELRPVPSAATRLRGATACVEVSALRNAGMKHLELTSVER